MKKRLEERVNTYGNYLKKLYGRRTFRAGISINKECPHRIMSGGCIFCLPETYSDSSLSKQYEPAQQLEKLIPKIKKGCGDVDLLAYFHHNTSTAGEVDELKQIFDGTLEHSEIKGLIISTRPDYLDLKIVEMLKNLKGDIFLEIGLQSIHQRSLDFLNRGHTLDDFARAIELCERYEIRTGVHLILGIPGETETDILETIRYLNNLQVISQIKFHNLVIYRGSKLASLPREVSDSIPGLDDYISLLATVLQHTEGDKVISRFFTSNVKRNEIALNSFPGYKREWQNRLAAYLKDHNIRQGSATAKPYHPTN